MKRELFAPANPWLWMTCLPMWFWRDNDNSGALTKKRLKKQCQVHVTQMIHLECSFITIRCKGEGQTKYTSIQHQHVQFPAHLKHFLLQTGHNNGVATGAWRDLSSTYCCVFLQTPPSCSIISQPKVAITRTGNHIITTGNIHMNRMMEGMGDRCVYSGLCSNGSIHGTSFWTLKTASVILKKNPFSIM